MKPVEWSMVSVSRLNVPSRREERVPADQIIVVYGGVRRRRKTCSLCFQGYGECWELR